MLNDLKDQAMMRNGCLVLCQFQIPSDVLFDYDRLVRSRKAQGGLIEIRRKSFFLSFRIVEELILKESTLQ